ncbi:MAG: methionine--tRNA ligase [Desulfurococcaceae archaeon]
METFYITTPIYYPNAEPHIGHAYTTVFADVIARFKRLTGLNVFFLTGNDEHGLKIQKVAEKLGKHPKEFVDEMATVYKKFWANLDIGYDYFIRTTNAQHESVVKEAFNYIYKKGLIYKSQYAGLYCVECEKYYTSGEYVEVNGKPHCPLHNKPLEHMEEETYYFKLSEFKDYVLEVLREKNRVYPRSYADEVISKIEKEGLKDLSVARPIERVWWGVPVPFDGKYIVYVWFDALLNYISAIGYLENKARFEQFWNEAHHVIGKDILWFHTAVWFSILKALDVEPPKKVIVHAFLTSRGSKMSKSIGNIISIGDVLSRYGGSDAVRYVIMRVFNMEKDSEVDFNILDNIYTSELVDTYGNLVRRVGVLAQKKAGGKVYKRSIDAKLLNTLNAKLNSYLDAMENFEVSRAAIEAVDVARLANQYLNETKPWEKSDPSKELYTVLEAIRLTTLMLYPFTPKSSITVAKSLGFIIDSPIKAGLESHERYDIASAPILYAKLDARRSSIKGEGNS